MKFAFTLQQKPEVSVTGCYAAVDIVLSATVMVVVDAVSGFCYNLCSTLHGSSRADERGREGSQYKLP